jgi:hypothetical protein
LNHFAFTPAACTIGGHRAKADRQHRRREGSSDRHVAGPLLFFCRSEA